MKIIRAIFAAALAAAVIALPVTAAAIVAEQSVATAPCDGCPAGDSQTGDFTRQCQCAACTVMCFSFAAGPSQNTMVFFEPARFVSPVAEAQLDSRSLEPPPDPPRS